MDILCTSCGTQIPSDPVKCPHCAVVQPRRAFDVRRHRRLTAAAGAMGVLGGLVWATVVPARPTVVYELSAAQEAVARAIRPRWVMEKIRLHGLGARIIDWSSLEEKAEVRFDGRIALAGYVDSPAIRKEGFHFWLASRNEKRQKVEVDAGSLPAKLRRLILLAPMRGSLISVWGYQSKLTTFYPYYEKAAFGMVADGVSLIGPAGRRYEEANVFLGD